MKITSFILYAILISTAITSFGTDVLAQINPGQIPGDASLYFREDWKETPAEIPLSQKHVANPDLILETYGPGADSLKKSHHDQPADDPWYVWSGQCLAPWAVVLRKKDSAADLSKNAYIRWRTKQAGGRVLRVILGLENGTWVVSREGTGVTEDWSVSVLNLNALSWRELDVAAVKSGGAVESPDLSAVHSIGCTDLMPGESSPVCSRLDWIEVYGKER